MGNALEQLRKETRDDARLYGCIRELYEQGVPFEELKAVIPDIRRTREQLHMKRMLENNNEVLMQMFSREMSFLLDAKEATRISYGYSDTDLFANNRKKNLGSSAADWWLRSAGSDYDNVVGCVDSDGDIVYSGVSYENLGVSPL